MFEDYELEILYRDEYFVAINKPSGLLVHKSMIVMKFYFENQTNIEEILVQDYYTQETLEAREAYFVTGSDVYGPMGNELLAFRDKKSAQRFMIDHRGKELLRFEEITVQKVYKLDE